MKRDNTFSILSVCANVILGAIAAILCPEIAKRISEKSMQGSDISTFEEKSFKLVNSGSIICEKNLLFSEYTFVREKNLY